MPAQIEAQRAKIDCSRKQLTNDGPNRQGQFINPDEGVAYSSVYYLNIPINKRVLYICWQQLFLLIIY